MVKAVLDDEKRLIPSSTLLEGEYGLKDICIGVPVRLGSSGVESVVQLELTDEETWAHLAVVNDRLYVRELNAMTVLSGGECER